MWAGWVTSLLVHRFAPEAVSLAACVAHAVFTLLANHLSSAALGIALQAAL